MTYLFSCFFFLFFPLFFFFGLLFCLSTKLVGFERGIGFGGFTLRFLSHNVAQQLNETALPSDKKINPVRALCIPIAPIPHLLEKIEPGI